MSLKISLAAGVSALALVVSGALAQDGGKRGGDSSQPQSGAASPGSRAPESGKTDAGKSDSGEAPARRSEGSGNKGRAEGKGAASAQSEREQGQDKSRAKDGPGRNANEGAGSQKRQAQDRQSSPAAKHGTAERSDQRKSQAQPSTKEQRSNSAITGEERQRSGAPSKSTPQSGSKHSEGKQGNAPSKGSTAQDGSRRGDRQGEAATGRSDADAARQDNVEQTRTSKLSDRQRTVVRERIQRQRPVGSDVRIDVNVSVGTRLPRNVRTTVLPPAIVQEVPAWRGYHYVVVRDEIVIVQPTTYQVVDVIETRGGGGIQTATLELTQEQRRIVYETVHDRYRPVDLRVRLGLGAQIPRTVQVETFPPDLVQRIPQLESYRCVVAEDQVVILEPGSREVVLLIDR